MRSVLTLLATVGVTASAAAQDYHFTKSIGSGGRIEIENINGNIELVRSNGSVAEVTVTKTVHSGDGSQVKAIMEESEGSLHVCTVYPKRQADNGRCNGDWNSDSRHNDHLDVEMRYVVKVPVGARVTVDDVNGSITATNIDGDASLNTVNGDVVYDGTWASKLETVSGKIIGRFVRGSWSGTVHVENVNGSVDLTFPASLSAMVSGETVNGGINSEFPITIDGKWGPKSFRGQIGNGGGRMTIETVNGGITLHRR